VFVKEIVEKKRVDFEAKQKKLEVANKKKAELMQRRREEQRR